MFSSLSDASIPHTYHYYVVFLRVTMSGNYENERYGLGRMALQAALIGGKSRSNGQ
ncbi:hypothetical protein WG78_14330 [Amantichitinum ursilacus]|uniref:Uncharacterized protein n=1 Tax=Amantichitinum ursilacus TaxID=857265 RepID=A0A0N1JSB4_9NEIS|nr:hypothetical protein WG78_14330 [Amantichitinum ursilacus]